MKKSELRELIREEATKLNESELAKGDMVTVSAPNMSRPFRARITAIYKDQNGKIAYGFGDKFGIWDDKYVTGDGQTK